MKTAIYIDEGTTQLVLTPDNEWEKAICAKIATGEQAVNIMRGSFWSCRGGWIRYDQNQSENESLILRVDVKAQVEA